MEEGACTSIAAGDGELVAHIECDELERSDQWIGKESAAVEGPWIAAGDGEPLAET